MATKNEKGFSPHGLILPLVLLVVFWILALVLWASTGVVFYIFNFGYIGTSLGIGIGLYELLPRRKKPIGRRVAQFLVGFYMIGFLGFVGFENMQIEGFFFAFLGGYFAGAVIHYLIAKIAGTPLLHRGWCAWACWTAMVLDLLPFKRSRGRLHGRWEWLRYAHFGLSLGIVLLFWFALAYRPRMDWPGMAWTTLPWLITGNLLYYATGIILAFALRDNRAFCKYVCPIAFFLKIGSRFSLLKIKGEPEKCTDCGTCALACPMDIRIGDYVKEGHRVLSSECILCLTCTNSCPENILRVSWGLDVGWKEHLYKVGERPGGPSLCGLVSPSPSRGTVHFSCAIPGPGPLSLSIYETAGRLVWQSDSWCQGPGSQAFSWEPGDASPGVYLYLVRSGQKTARGRIVIK